MTQHRRRGGFTWLELLVVIFIIALFVFFMVPTFMRPKQGSRIFCINNLMQLGTAYQIWANDNGDRFPFATSVTNGGWRELLDNTNAGPYCWTNYTILENEMGQSPRLLNCPQDERHYAVAF